ncbi:ribonuclease Z [Parendozoicomonas sp. Alg238-R29]|uniref:ribonuclease Z n=1 Tax=Parendozoicomonas sp. Alg238-R29 TaxID=2993446 RepID=UPI00248D617B|nr:ribonuclease Z [Parendozoicomonas sp. Alg238-R29]
MRLTFLGTAAGLPSRDRNVTALILAKDDSKEWCLIDCGEGTQHRLLGSRYTLKRLQAIFITHVHGDHMFGLPGLITSASMQGRTEPLVICAPDGVESFVRHSLACAAVSQLPFELIFKASDKDGFEYSTSDYKVTSHPLSHRVPCFAYGFDEQPDIDHLCPEKLAQLGIPRGPLWGLLQQGKPVTLPDGRIVDSSMVREPSPKGRFAVIGGDNDQPEILHDVLTKADILVHEATFSTSVREKVGGQWMHSTPAQVGTAAEKAGVKHVILTHFSNRYQKRPRPGQFGVEELREEAKAVYSGTVTLASDHGCWEMDRDRHLKEV